MKTLLIIGYLGLYRTGSKRVIGLANYLPEFGWRPIIVTAPLDRKPPPNVQYVETRYKDSFMEYKSISRIKNIPLLKPLLPALNYLEARCAEIITYPDSEISWAKYANEVACHVISKQKIDAIMSIYPMTSHLVAKNIKESMRSGGYEMKWLADFPDLWSSNHNPRYSRIRKWFDKRLEVKTLATADAIVTTSEPLAERMGEIHKGKKVYSITLGYDPNDVNNPPRKLTDKFTITYTGLVYEGMQDVSKLFLALKELLTDKFTRVEDIEVRFYGKGMEKLKDRIEKYGLSSIVKVYGEVSHEVSLEMQRESQSLLFLNWDDPKETGLYGGKIFEYLGSRRPILATGGVSGNVVDNLLRQTLAGVQATTVEEIRLVLGQYYNECKKQGFVSYKGTDSQIQEYSHREMARKFAELLEGTE
jgi:glycosyltransferase involved in cell wall biosynthesis